jgi:hypothetical protein
MTRVEVIVFGSCRREAGHILTKDCACSQDRCEKDDQLVWRDFQLHALLISPALEAKRR